MFDTKLDPTLQARCDTLQSLWMCVYGFLYLINPTRSFVPSEYTSIMVQQTIIQKCSFDLHYLHATDNTKYP